jgi:Phosphodiester glycosidase
MRWSLLLVFCLPNLACAQTPGAVAAATQPAPFDKLRAGGISYSHEVRKDPPMHLHVVRVDLTDPAISVVVRPGGADPDGAGPWETVLATVRSVANRDNLAVAVNGDFFAPKDSHEILGRKVPYFDGNWAKVIGYAMSDQKVWATPINPAEPALVVTPGNKVAIVSRPAEIPKDATQIVGGSGLVVENGKVVGKSKDLAPRTAVGIDKEGKHLILLVVDGRRPEYSAGMTLDQLGAEMVRLGCDRAMNLDGGGSSTMVMRDPKTQLLEVKNRPSDGHDFVLPLSVERPVANVLGVRIKDEGGSMKDE